MNRFTLVLSGLVIISLAGCLDGESWPTAEADEPLRQSQGALTTCLSSSDCATNEACTQGGHCVDITGQLSATEALQADFDQLETPVGLGVPYKLPPNARLKIDDVDGDGIGLKISTKIILDGNGAAFVIDNGIIGLRIQDSSQWSSVRDLSFVSSNNTEVHDGIGLDVRAHGLRLDNLFFNRMGTGVRAFTFVDGERANLNIQQWSRLVFSRCHQYAINMSGGDANAGLLSGIEVVAGNGIRDNSFLGNTHLAPSINSTTQDSITLGSNAGASTVLGAYTESNAPIMRSASFHDLHIGGNAIDRLDSPGDRIGRHASSLRFRHPSGLRVRIPGAAHAPFAMNHQSENEWWYLRYFDDPAWRIWAFSYRNLGENTVYRWTGGDHEKGPARYQLGEPLDDSTNSDENDDDSNGNGGGPPPHARRPQSDSDSSTTPDEPEEYFEETEEPYHEAEPIEDDYFFWDAMEID